MFQGKAIFCPSEKFMIIASNTNVNVGPMKKCRGLISNVIRNAEQFKHLHTCKLSICHLLFCLYLYSDFCFIFVSIIDKSKIVFYIVCAVLSVVAFKVVFCGVK